MLANGYSINPFYFSETFDSRLGIEKYTIEHGVVLNS